MNEKTENKIIKLLEELERIIPGDCEVSNKNYEIIKRLQDSVNYKLNHLIQCDE